jgi:hypothetical protein
MHEEARARRLLSWRETSSFEPQLFSGELSDLRRRVHHQWGALSPVRLQ